MPSNKDDIFGGMFDFDGDGKTDIGEEFLAYMMFEELSKDEEKTKADSSTDFDEFEVFDEDISDDLDELDEYDDELEDEPSEPDCVSSPSSIYENAERLIESENYKQAKDDLKGIEDSNYRDTSALILLCTAHIEYNSGRTVDAYYTLKDTDFRYQTLEQQRKISGFRNTLDSEYKTYINRMIERQQQEYENKIVNGVPYVGMPESRIADTTLGKPSDKIRHNSEMINGQRYTANLYDFYRNGKRIFTARCIQGRVTEVWDERNNSTELYLERQHIPMLSILMLNT